MTAGLPGVGLSGLFVLFSALLMPLVELVRTARGRSSLARWRRVGAHWSMAVGMVAVYAAAIELAARLSSTFHGARAAAHQSGVVSTGFGAAVGTVSISIAVLTLLLVATSVASRSIRNRNAPA